MAAWLSGVRVRDACRALPGPCHSARLTAGAGLVLAALILASPLRADEGLFLTWRGCPADHAATHDLTGACDTNVGEQSLFCSFTLPQAVDSVIALELVVDLQAMDATLPAWWRLGAGDCRDGALTVNADVSGSTCALPWQGLVQSPSVLLAGFFAGEPRGGAAQARFKITVAVLPDSFRRLEAGVTYLAARLVLSNNQTTGCPGCAVPTCLVLNSILVGRLENAPGGNVLLKSPGAGNANRATWQGLGADCGAVPVKRRSWGALKSIYR